MEILTIDNKKNLKFLKRRVPETKIESLDRKALRALIKEMRMLMKKADGVGLSANQIGLSLRLFTAEVPKGKGGAPKFYAILNPEIFKASKENTLLEEGCLSVPETFGSVLRSSKIIITGFDQNGRKMKLKAWGFLAKVFQHEVDHLNGILFIDRARVVKKIAKVKP